MTEESKYEQYHMCSCLELLATEKLFHTINFSTYLSNISVVNEPPSDSRVQNVVLHLQGRAIKLPITGMISLFSNCS